MENHKKKMGAPIIITVIVIAYFVFYFAFLVSVMDSLFLKILFAVIPVLLGAAMIAVCIQRIKEIKGGEEDDLSQY